MFMYSIRPRSNVWQIMINILVKNWRESQWKGLTTTLIITTAQLQLIEHTNRFLLNSFGTWDLPDHQNERIYLQPIEDCFKNFGSKWPSIYLYFESKQVTALARFPTWVGYLEIKIIIIHKKLTILTFLSSSSSQQREVHCWTYTLGSLLPQSLIDKEPISIPLSLKYVRFPALLSMTLPYKNYITKKIQMNYIYNKLELVLKIKTLELTPEQLIQDFF